MVTAHLLVPHDARDSSDAGNGARIFYERRMVIVLHKYINCGKKDTAALTRLSCVMLNLNPHMQYIVDD